MIAVSLAFMDLMVVAGAGLLVVYAVFEALLGKGRK